ncbi:DNA helicase II; NERD domain-containing protein [Thioalkalivibrio nitratireducens DSM 14787]|uniref:DNA 3'-5' helicase II n=1 Tax=Thioalkalivibrio nitratireducens (strain DSM 14787 / UNIQEM 213 / ALEN2) TaxID=1255043 RepID=L0DZB9_THIND|nr:3'-5' exonuclease [Thioalkalivibrio nitratireducens]AGA34924.1 DNA helicase II; NERD domain-containing protein [Thioalkalivibrio nitratireducens DSM 14787]
MTGGEKRFARRLEAKLEDDYLVWYDVPVGSRGFHPDFIVLHPRRGLLVLEVKDWRLDTIKAIHRFRASILTARGLVSEANPLEQARGYACAIASLLQKDPALVASGGHPYAGKLLFPWGYGAVLANITRRQFESTDLGEVLAPHQVICQDEILEDVDTEAFQQKLWGMFSVQFGEVLTLPQIDRIRWHIFPEIRIGAAQAELFENTEEPLPDLLRVMDLQQEQLARSLGEGHRVIHGVAGSGKTMILAYRCLHLARAMNRPILALCFNVPLATRLEALLREQGLEDQVSVRSFHAWCRSQLVHYHVPLPSDGKDYADQLVQRVIKAVDRQQIPAGQYGAVLIDEGHDFAAHWLKLLAQMVDPATNALLLLYDDAQSIYGKSRRGKFSFKSVGIQAQGRTTILKLNYRNTTEVLRLAHAFAKDVLTPADADEDGVPLVLPESSARHGPPPELVRLPSFSAEADYIADRLCALHGEGTPWRDMAIVYRNHFMGEKLTSRLAAAGVPVDWLHRSHDSRRYRTGEDSVKVVTFHSSKGLEFPVVAIPGMGYLPHEHDDPEDEVRLMYVAMTRAMERLVITYHRESAFVARLAR